MDHECEEDGETMALSNANCLLCGAPLVYADAAQEMTCAICGKTETGHCACADDHYICDACHREKGVAFILDACRASISTNPIELAQQIMTDRTIYPNGPEHHTLVGAVLLTCYQNAGGAIDLDQALDELRRRSLQVPGGTCGFWGVCGAAASAGQFYAIISGSTPLAAEPWASTARLTANIMGRLASVGGPRCCKRNGFIAIEESVRYVAATTGIAMKLPERTLCTFMGGNDECLKRECPFFPKHSANTNS